jgi:hypothetical protein
MRMRILFLAMMLAAAGAQAQTSAANPSPADAAQSHWIPWVPLEPGSPAPQPPAGQPIPPPEFGRPQAQAGDQPDGQKDPPALVQRRNQLTHRLGSEEHYRDLQSGAGAAAATTRAATIRRGLAQERATAAGITAEHQAVTTANTQALRRQQAVEAQAPTPVIPQPLPDPANPPGFTSFVRPRLPISPPVGAIGPVR